MNGHVGDAITALRDQLKNISSNQREKEIKGKVPLQSGEQWMKRGQEPRLSNPCVSRQRNMTKHERLDKKLFNEVEQKDIEINSHSFLEFQTRLQF